MSVIEKRPDLIKKACNRAHARSRAFERYGLYPTNDQLDSFAERIAGGHRDAVPLRHANSGDRQLVALKVDGEYLPVVYEPGTRSIVTFLPHRALDRYRSYLDGLGNPDAVPVRPAPRPTRDGGRRPTRDRPLGPGTPGSRRPDPVQPPADPSPLLDFPAYSPPGTPPQTLGEARGRLADLQDLLRRMGDAIEAARARGMDDLVGRYSSLRMPVSEESASLSSAISETLVRCRQSCGGDREPSGDMPLPVATLVREPSSGDSESDPSGSPRVPETSSEPRPLTYLEIESLGKPYKSRLARCETVADAKRLREEIQYVYSRTIAAFSRLAVGDVGNLAWRKGIRPLLVANGDAMRSDLSRLKARIKTAHIRWNSEQARSTPVTERDQSDHFQLMNAAIHAIQLVKEKFGYEALPRELGDVRDAMQRYLDATAPLIDETEDRPLAGEGTT